MLKNLLLQDPMDEQLRAPKPQKFETRHSLTVEVTEDMRVKVWRCKEPRGSEVWIELSGGVRPDLVLGEFPTLEEGLDRAAYWANATL